ncbi:DUF2628 domain-containing protein [Photobacterium damselae]|uniref:DUF2628 domain-containing protein n=1 Tax=Photobacterium damselae TaxID=38293 RepID=UPI001F30D59A|nr:DUF2628 domain-containing protein [Photobacterium damselae]UKA12891.1 DUF2628 domain-containing protein [Photobacterium damselae subsp. damselae]
MNNIDELNVSNRWKEKFKLIQEIGGDNTSSSIALQKSEEFKALPLNKRLAVNYNFFAFIFTALWYFAKGMWARGVVIFSLSFLLNCILGAVSAHFNYTFPGVVYWVVPAVLSATHANVDYYRFKVHGERIWKDAFWGGALDNKASVTLLFISSILLGMMIAVVFDPEFQEGFQEGQAQTYNTQQDLPVIDDILWGVWASRDGSLFLSKNYEGQLFMNITTASYPIPLKVVSIDNDNYIVTFKANPDTKSPFIITMRQEWDRAHETFTVSMSLNDSAPETLSFVREVNPNDYLEPKQKPILKPTKDLVSQAKEAYKPNLLMENESISVEKVDLNNDGIDEILLTSSSYCGSSGCTYEAYSSQNGKVCSIGSVSDINNRYKGKIDCNTQLAP